MWTLEWTCRVIGEKRSIASDDLCALSDLQTALKVSQLAVNVAVYETLPAGVYVPNDEADVGQRSTDWLSDEEIK